MASKPKTNGCLVAEMCAAWFAGYTKCGTYCHWDLLYRSMKPSFRDNFKLFVMRAAPHVRRMGSSIIKGVYFGRNESG